MQVHVLQISHRHGDNISVHFTRSSADAALAGFCREWWKHELGDEVMPEDPEEACQIQKHMSKRMMDDSVPLSVSQIDDLLRDQTQWLKGLGCTDALMLEFVRRPLLFVRTMVQHKDDPRGLLRALDNMLVEGK